MVDARPCTADDIVADLVAHGTLEPQQGEAVLHALEPVLVPSHLSTVPVRVGLRRHAAEIAGYLGAVFVALSAVAFLSQSWETFTLLTRALTLAGIAVLTGAIAVAVLRGSPLTAAADATRRRLAGTLFAASAVTAGMGVGVALEDLLEDTPTLVGLAPATALVVAMVGYRWAPTALGHVTMLGAAFATVMSIATATGEESLVVAGLLVLAIGGAWYLLTRSGVLREPVLGIAAAAFTAFAGAQIVQAGLDPTTGVRVLSYVLTALVAAACLAGYATTQRWPLLAVGVLATAVVVPEVLSEWLGDSLGIPGLLLASGVTLLGASLLGLRMGRRGAPRPDEVTAGSTPPR
jgi:hypothetical protein